jgi:hypothetical protein
MGARAWSVRGADIAVSIEVTATLDVCAKRQLRSASCELHRLLRGMQLRPSFRSRLSASDTIKRRLSHANPYLPHHR